MDRETRRTLLIALGVISILYIYHSAKPFDLINNLVALCTGNRNNNDESVAARELPPVSEMEHFENGENGQNDRQEETEAAENQESEEPNTQAADAFPKQQLSADELLPGKGYWEQVVPSSGGELGDQNFLTAGYHVGVNTVGQTLRNANRQIRSEPCNPQIKVSPWLQSTIECDTNRRPLEIGGCE